MNFSNDRDLLALEPTVFNDVPFLGQQRVRSSDGALSGTTLTSAAADFAASGAASGGGVEAGQVILIAGVPHEITARSDAHTLTVSLLRPALGDAPFTSTQGSGLEIIVRTFAPQATFVHDVLLRLLGLIPEDPAVGATLNEDAVVSLSVMARLEALGTLERLYSAAATLTGDNKELQAKAQRYHQEFRAALTRSTVLLDTDGDGYADLRRCPGLVNLVRV